MDPKTASLEHGEILPEVSKKLLVPECPQNGSRWLRDGPPAKGKNEIGIIRIAVYRGDMLCAALSCSGLLCAALGCFGLLWAALRCCVLSVLLCAALGCSGLL